MSAGRLRRFVSSSRARRAVAGAAAALTAVGLFAGCFAPAPSPTDRRDAGSTTSTPSTSTTTTTTTAPTDRCGIVVVGTPPSVTVEVHTTPVLAGVSVDLHRFTPSQDLTGTTGTDGVASFPLAVVQPTLLHATVDGRVECDGHIS